MSSLWERTAEPPIHVRFAEPGDARAISQLYVRTYTPEGGGAASDHYPFPQIMEEDNVVDLITGAPVIWVVAEDPDGALAGSAAAARNIGGRQDRIAEIFGVAVEQAWRRRGIGSALLQKLQTELANSAEFILCEARTAEAGGWKAARNAGFKPVGFEPYAHAMPVGFESMVLTASWNWDRKARHIGMRAAENANASLKLAEAVCPPDLQTLFSLEATDYRLPKRDLLERNEVFTVPINVRRDDHSGRVWFAGPADTLGRQSALAEIWPFYGVERRFRRFEHAYYVASTGASDVAAARVLYDRTDARARILGLRTVVDGVELRFVEGIVDDLLQLSRGKPLVIVAYVRAGTLSTQTGLESMSFIPTAYFPGMISVQAGRTDVIQYTRLSGHSWFESIGSVTALEWPEARRIIDRVLQFHPDP